MASKRVKEISVTVTSMRDGEKRVKAKSGASVHEVLVRAGLGDMDLQASESSLRLNGAEASLEDKVSDGDYLFLAPAVKGGR